MACRTYGALRSSCAPFPPLPDWANVGRAYGAGWARRWGRKGLWKVPRNEKAGGSKTRPYGTQGALRAKVTTYPLRFAMGVASEPARTMRAGSRTQGRLNGSFILRLPWCGPGGRSGIFVEL
jgi:hypothetical protein